MKLCWLRQMVALSLVISLSGCVQLRFNQYEKVTQWLSETAPKTIYHPYLWDITINNYQTTMLQVDLTEKVGFTNKKQEAIIFADNRVVALGPLGPYRELIKIKHIQNDQTVQTRSGLVQIFHNEVDGVLMAVEKCSTWQLINNKRLQQSCIAETTYINTMDLDEKGNIVHISQFLPTYNTRLVLQKRTVVSSSL